MKQLSLTRFEVFKLFSRKSVWIFLGLMLLTFYLLHLFQSSPSIYQPYFQPTPPSAQQVQQAKTNLEQVKPKLQAVPGGSSEFWKLLSDEQRDEAIITAASGTAMRVPMDEVQQALTNLKAHGQTGFTYRMDSLEYSMFKHLPFVGSGQYVGAGSEMANFFPSFGQIIFGAMILIGLSSVFSDEYMIGMDSFLLTTKRGRRKLVTAKLIASTLYIFVMETILTGVNLLYNLTAFNLKGFNYPWQSIGYMAPYHLSIWQYILVATVIQLLGGLTFGFVVLLSSSWNRSSLVSFFISAGILALPELIASWSQQPWAQTIMNFSYIGLLQVSRLFNSFIAYDMFGYPVLYPIIVISMAILISIPIVRLIYFGFCNRQVA
jgi:hypothetical protein